MSQFFMHAIAAVLWMFALTSAYVLGLDWEDGGGQTKFLFALTLIPAVAAYILQASA